ncbi:unnamed protein product [Adineta ricciae]|uniref:Leucine--tRNA ligase ubiquitin-like domain-containing protein n=1 Tax=Adineta ricciae TaxID=249248 RepID=A0A814UQB1_ADIRI|nr:unnamed protein product [Adineta ricciae]CAF1177440.1 unnamed protein product [Adineta ricciae]
MFRIRHGIRSDPRPSESNAIPSPGFHRIRRIPVGSDKILYGIRVWDCSTWDEVLSNNEDYFRRTLNIEQVDIRLIDENEIEAASIPNLEEILPGKPLIHFRHEPMISIRLINRQPYSGHFEWTIPVINGDTVEKLEQRLRRHADRTLRFSKTIRLFYFRIWQFHSRKLPSMDTPLEDLVELTNKQQVLQVDLKYETVVSEQQDIGNALVYFVE